MEKTITIKAKDIYEADNKLREYCICNKAYPLGVSRLKTGEYIGYYINK